MGRVCPTAAPPKPPVPFQALATPWPPPACSLPVNGKSLFAAIPRAEGGLQPLTRVLGAPAACRDLAAVPITPIPAMPTSLVPVSRSERPCAQPGHRPHLRPADGPHGPRWHRQTSHPQSFLLCTLPGRSLGTSLPCVPPLLASCSPPGRPGDAGGDANRRLQH